MGYLQKSAGLCKGFKNLEYYLIIIQREQDHKHREVKNSFVSLLHISVCCLVYLRGNRVDLLEYNQMVHEVTGENKATMNQRPTVSPK